MIIYNSVKHWFSAPPKILRSSSNQIVMLGDNFSINIDVDGIPQSYCEWYRNGKPLNPILLDSDQIERINIDKNRYFVLFKVYNCYKNQVQEFHLVVFFPLNFVYPFIGSSFSYSLCLNTRLGPHFLLLFFL